MNSRRWFCDQPDCSRRIFTERLPGLARRYSQRTEEQAQLLRLLAYVLGGEAGSRTAAALGMPSSPDTVLRQLRQGEHRATHTPRVLGVDDWAFRRGHHYGTILVDLERGCPVDLLPDRSADTLAAWLKEHPGVEVISRDRGGNYADGARRGAPEAQQIADRWHLLKNLAEALEGTVDRQRAALRQVAAGEHVTAPLPPAEAAEGLPPAITAAEPLAAVEDAAGLPRAEREQRRRREQRLERYEEVLRLHREGYSDRAIATLTGKSRHTVRKYWQAESFPEISRRRRGRTTLTPFLPYLERRWREGCHNAAQLWRELQEQGFRGSRTTVADFVARWRKQLPPELRRTSGPKPRGRGRVEVPSPRSVTWWLLHPDEKLHARQIAFRERLLEVRPELRRAQQVVREFFTLVRTRRGQELESWMKTASESGIEELQRFAAGLRRDWDAVVAGLTLDWSNGPVEGQVNRLKLIKRQMYGRASLELLRARVLKPG